MWLSGASAGFTVPKILALMGPRSAPHVEKARQWILDGTTRGDDLSSVVRRGGARFESFERSLLILGDESGTMEKSLRLLAEFYQKKYQLMLVVRKQMAYPLFTGIIATFVAPFSLLYFGHVAAYLGTVALGLAGWVVSGGAIVLWAARRYGRKPRLVRARLARALVTAIEAGLPLARSVRLAAGASGDADVERYVAAIDERTLGGQSLVATLAGCPHMSPDFMAVLEVAERTGDFSGSIGRLAKLYEDGFR